MRRWPVTMTAWLKPYCTVLKTVSGLTTVRDMIVLLMDAAPRGAALPAF